jgi:hypothetical protein
MTCTLGCRCCQRQTTTACSFQERPAPQCGVVTGIDSTKHLTTTRKQPKLKFALRTSMQCRMQQITGCQSNTQKPPACWLSKQTRIMCVWGRACLQTLNVSFPMLSIVLSRVALRQPSILRVEYQPGPARPPKSTTRAACSNNIQ